MSGVEATYRAIYSAWLPQSSVAPDDFAAIDHYVHDGSVGGDITYDILIKVCPRR